MAEQVNRGQWVEGFNLNPDQVHHWKQAGQPYGRVRWFYVFPAATLVGVNRSVKIEETFTRVDETGERYVHVKVRNLGSTLATYIIWVAETTGP